MELKILSPDEFKRFDSFFKPNSIAIVGVSKKRGFWWLNNFVQAGFRGKIFPINPNIESHLGIPFYKSILDIPESETIDYCLISIPNKRVPGVLKQCFERNVRLITIFTSGFSETGIPENIKLEEQIRDMIKENNYKTRVIGPNCMGLYVPNRLHFNYGLSKFKGHISILSQSGGLAQNISYKLANLGIALSKVVSFGNQVDLDVIDFLKYLNDDRSTRFIGIYLEGLKPKKGREFFEIVKKIARKKPIAFWKGGQTPEGARAAQSHTGAIMGSTGSRQLWQALQKQTGFINVKGFDELIDIIVMFNYYNYKKYGDLKGKVCIISISGGVSVSYTDVLVSEGLTVPRLHESTIEDLTNSLQFLVGNSMKNPVDLASDFFNFASLDKIFTAIKKDKNTDCIIFELNIQYTRMDDPYWIERTKWIGMFYERLSKSLNEIKKAGKPVLFIIPPIIFFHKLIEDWEFFLQRFPVFLSIESAARALKTFVEYCDFYHRKNKATR
ncbi:MAG: CoA-binding protein [Candidatus Helarchaeota archaeon]